jgi:hypothetical protein
MLGLRRISVSSYKTLGWLRLKDSCLSVPPTHLNYTEFWLVLAFKHRKRNIASFPRVKPLVNRIRIQTASTPPSFRNF